jgi:hypothetical protein
VIDFLSAMDLHQAGVGANATPESAVATRVGGRFLFYTLNSCYFNQSLRWYHGSSLAIQHSHRSPTLYFVQLYDVMNSFRRKNLCKSLEFEH